MVEARQIGEQYPDQSQMLWNGFRAKLGGAY